MRKILIGVFITVILVFFLQYCEYQRDNREEVKTNSALIEQQLQNVGKLIVTEGTYAEVFSYEDSKEMFFTGISSTKKAIVVVNAQANVAYDLSEVSTKIDQENKIVTITSIPEAQLSINPKIEYFDIENGYTNYFDASDHKKITERVEKTLREKVEASNLMTNAENRLISELQKIYILTSSLGWTLQYNGKSISSQADFNAPLLD